MSVLMWVCVLQTVVIALAAVGTYFVREQFNALAKVIESSNSTIVKLGRALGIYADPVLWKSDPPHKRSPAARDRGHVAREALKQAWPS
jgi:hypothetical protein